MDPEFPGFVGTGAYDTAALRVPANDHGLALEFGIVSLLDRGKERVHIDVDEFFRPIHKKQLNAQRAKRNEKLLLLSR
jgi:hypothetical protein